MKKTIYVVEIDFIKFGFPTRVAALEFWGLLDKGGLLKIEEISLPYGSGFDQEFFYPERINSKPKLYKIEDCYENKQEALRSKENLLKLKKVKIIKP